MAETYKRENKKEQYSGIGAEREWGTDIIFVNCDLLNS